MCGGVLVTATGASSQDAGRESRIELRVGMAMRVNTDASVSERGVRTETDASGVLAGVGYALALHRDLTLTMGFNLLEAGAQSEVDSGGVETRTVLILPFYVGLRRYLPSSAPEPGVRLFGSAEVGPVMGFEQDVRVGGALVVEAITLNAFGARLGGGVEVLLGSRATLSLQGGYNLMSDFREPIGGQVNHGGPDVSLGLGIILG